MWGKRRRLTFVQFLLSKFSQLIHLRRLPRHRPFNDFDSPSQRSPNRNRIGCCSRHHANDPNAWVLRAAIMHPVPEIAYPGLESRRVVFPHNVTVSDNRRLAGHGGPFSRRVQEGDVDLRVAFDVVRLA